MWGEPRSGAVSWRGRGDRRPARPGLCGLRAWQLHIALGTVKWTSGADAGRWAEVLAHDLVDGLAILTLLEAPVHAIAEGDSFLVRAGCDKRIETCGTKFGNVVNFRGFPHIPGQDAVLRYASKERGHEGAVL